MVAIRHHHERKRIQISHRNACKFDAPVLGIILFLDTACSGSPQTGIDESTAGQVIGGIAGERIGANMEQRDMQRTADALEYNERAETTACRLDDGTWEVID